MTAYRNDLLSGDCCVVFGLFYVFINTGSFSYTELFLLSSLSPLSVANCMNFYFFFNILFFPFLFPFFFFHKR